PLRLRSETPTLADGKFHRRGWKRVKQHFEERVSPSICGSWCRRSARTIEQSLCREIIWIGKRPLSSRRHGRIFGNWSTSISKVPASRSWPERHRDQDSLLWSLSF